MQSRMQSEPTGVREAVLKHMATPKDLWTIWSILAIFSGCALLLSIATTVTEVLAKSSHVLDWAAWTVAWSIWFFAAAYARRPEYYGAILQLRSAWHRNPVPRGSEPVASVQGLPRPGSVSASAPRFWWA